MPKRNLFSLSFFLFPVLGLMLVMGACNKEERQNQLISQEAAIDNFVASIQQKDTVYYQNGVVRAVLRRDTASLASKDTLAPGDSASFFYAGYIFKNGKGSLFHTNSDSVAKANNWPLSVEEAKVVGFRSGDGSLIKGLDYGMIGMQEGEYAYVIFNSDYGFANTAVGNVPKMTALLYEVWMEQIVKK